MQVSHSIENKTKYQNISSSSNSLGKEPATNVILEKIKKLDSEKRREIARHPFTSYREEHPDEETSLEKNRRNRTIEDNDAYVRFFDNTKINGKSLAEILDSNFFTEYIPEAGKFAAENPLTMPMVIYKDHDLRKFMATTFKGITSFLKI